ncbi:malonyl-CoA synthase [Xinfangfangia sp. CPCC 101601]|uniref:Malonyl-CoA synthase n=1 Tax=Pseudogemmobacter lacusdianii TaxID=3069608 RepID=A0ABU0W152_9RHOB|nr:malonyl-CoA synthase [Xinfangfangia sp. CPCC 101601]MDQ2067744.1 malonyl-CoA synthase [Xinfangfangia sp. CPCC 101601]
MTNHLFDGLSRGQTSDNALFLEHQGQSLSYAEAWARSAQLARALVSLGVEPDDRVAVQAEKSVEMVLLYLACLRAGAIFLPLNTAYTSAEMAYFIDDAEAAVLVNDSGALPDGAGGAGKKPPVALTMAQLSVLADGMAADFATVARGPDDLAAILYTSGTTGRSKGAMLSHDNLLSNARALKAHWRFTDADRLVHALPIFHAHGLFVAINVTMVAGGSLIFHKKFDADAVLADLPRATSFMGVPTFYTRLLQHEGLTKAACAQIRLFVSGSAPLLAETHRAFEERTGHRILERYGMTETTMIASNPYEGERRAGTVGQALPGITLRVADPESHAPLAQGETGMVELRGPNVFKGYWRMPEKTASEFTKDGFFITGDLGKFDADGYLHIVGRDKDLVISGGYNVYPIEVETLIDAIDGVLESAVIGVPHPDFGEAVTAVVVAKPGAALEGAAILAGLATQLARFKQPKEVIFMDELPRNTMGKVQKSELRRRFQDLYRA